MHIAIIQSYEEKSQLQMSGCDFVVFVKPLLHIEIQYANIIAKHKIFYYIQASAFFFLLHRVRVVC